MLQVAIEDCRGEDRGMSKKQAVWAIAASAVVLSACSGGNDPEPTVTVTAETVAPSTDPEVPSDFRDDATRASLDFAITVVDERRQEGGNAVVSPASISYSMVIAGTGAVCTNEEALVSALGVPAEEREDTYLSLAADLAGREEADYATRLSGLILSNSTTGRADNEALSDLAERYSLSHMTVPESEIGITADMWALDASDGRRDGLAAPLSASADYSVLLNLSYWSTWSASADVTTLDFEFEDGRREPVPALELPALAWEADSGTILELPTTSPDSTYLYYPDVAGTLGDLTADDWAIPGEGQEVVLTVPTLSASVTTNVENLGDQSFLASGCENPGFGASAEGSLASQHASYEFGVDGIAADHVGDVVEPGRETLTPDRSGTNAKIIAVDRAFAVMTVDEETGWALLYGMIGDPTVRN